MTKVSRKYSPDLIVIGGGLAGSEAAWQAAERGIRVRIFEMRPSMLTGAHTGDYLAELVCSNSLGSNQPDRAGGILKQELRQLGSLLMRCADETAVPAGGALAVDREAFASQITHRLVSHPNIEIIREEITAIPDVPNIVASGPLTSARLSAAIAELGGRSQLYFYDAIAPIISLDSIDFNIAFRGSRYGRGELEDGDYINCPMTQEEYEVFIDALTNAARIELKEFEKDLEEGVQAGRHHFFEGCVPVEVLAQRGRETLAFGPLRPVGLIDPRTGKRPHAVVQLRQDNLAGSLYNMVGFQTNLKFLEQRRVFRMIPGLEQAVFERYGQMHRNTFIYSPDLLLPTLQFKNRDDLFFAGQIIGVEGYVGNFGTGLIAGVNASRLIHGRSPLVFPKDTLLGALCHYVTHAAAEDFQPMKANLGILPPLDEGEGFRRGRRGKRARATLFAERSEESLREFIAEQRVLTDIIRKTPGVNNEP